MALDNNKIVFPLSDFDLKIDQLKLVFALWTSFLMFWYSHYTEKVIY